MRRLGRAYVCAAKDAGVVCCCESLCSPPPRSPAPFLTLHAPPLLPPSRPQFNTQRKTTLWGPDAQKFDPDRWLDERVKIMTANPFIFQPFNAGPRICIGQQLAYNTASFLLIRLLQTYSRVELATDVQPPSSIPPAGVAGTESWPDKIWPVAE